MQLSPSQPNIKLNLLCVCKKYQKLESALFSHSACLNNGIDMQNFNILAWTILSHYNLRAWSSIVFIHGNYRTVTQLSNYFSKGSYQEWDDPSENYGYLGSSPQDYQSEMAVVRLY